MTRWQGVLVTLVVVIVAGIFYAVRHVTLDSDYSAFLPSGTSQTQRALMRELREGLGSRVMLIALEGAPPETLADTSRRLGAALAASPHFRYASNGTTGVGERELALVAAHRYALSDRLDTPGAFAPDALRAALLERLESLGTSAGVLEKMFLANDPMGDARRVLSRMTPPRSPQRIHGVWFDAPGTSALLVAQTKAFGSDLAGQAAAIAALDAMFEASRASPSMRITVSSPGTMAVESRARIAGDARTLSIVSAAGVLLILAWAYRSVVVLALCVAPALCGLLAGVVLVDAVFGTVHGITLAFGATLLGEAVDYPSYLLTQVRQGSSPQRVKERLAVMLSLAMLTTMCGAVALLFSGFPGLAQLGMLTVVGVLVAGLATLWVLPHAVPAGWTPRPPPRWAWLGRVPAPSPRVAWGVVVLVTVVAVAVAWNRPWWDDDLASMSPLPESARANDARLRAAIGAPDARTVLVVSAGTREDVLQQAEALRPDLERAVASGAMASFDLVSDLLPSEATQRRRQQALPDPDTLRADFAAAVLELPFRPGVFEPFLQDVAAARAASPVTPDTYQGSAIGMKIEGLLREDGAQWHVVVPLTDLRDAAALERGLPATARLIDLRGEVTAMMAAYRERGIAFSAIGILLMYAVLVVGMRSFTDSARVLLPTLLATLTTAAVLVALGERLSVFHYVALLLTTGIGVNYALLFAAPAAREDRAALWRTVAVVSATALTTFGVLAFAHAPVLHAIGLTVCAGVVMSLLFAALVVQPIPGRAR